jgi:hypothetical protein
LDAAARRVGQGLWNDLSATPPGPRQDVLRGAYEIWLLENGVTGGHGPQGARRAAVGGCQTNKHGGRPPKIAVNHPSIRTEQEQKREAAALASLVQAVRERVAQDGGAWVLVDIDDTLVDSRAHVTYTARVIGEQFDMECLRRAVSGDVPKAEVFSAIHDEWLAKGRSAESEGELHRAFVTLNDRLAAHGPTVTLVAGAKAYLAELANAGARLLFLTARVDGTPEATARRLRQVGFPVGGRHAVVTRPDGALSAAKFKVDVVAEHPHRACIVGVIDDDTRNLTALTAILPGVLLLQPQKSGENDLAPGAIPFADYSAYQSVLSSVD